MRNTPGLPFGPGSARPVDPLAEAGRIAEERKTGGVVAVHAADLAVLVALASLGAASFSAGDAGELPAGMTIEDAEAVLERYLTP